MISVLTLAALAAMLALPPGTQPRQRFSTVFPKNVRFAPSTLVVPQPVKNKGVCSVPLLNALNGRSAAFHLHMPTVKPDNPGTMRFVDPPAPPCEQ